MFVYILFILCFRYFSCWKGCCLGGGCRAASQVGWSAGSEVVVSWQGELVRVRVSIVGLVGFVGIGGRRKLGRFWGREQGGVVCYFRLVYLLQGLFSIQGFGSYVLQDVLGSWLSEYRQGQQGFRCGSQFGVRFQYYDKDRTQFRRQVCSWGRVILGVIGF